jgi:antirestriction protein ArdC
MARTKKSKGKSRKARGPKKDHYQAITDRILAAMENEDIAPWQKPWTCNGVGGSAPINGVSKKAYRGINIWLTLMTAWERGYSSNVWLSFKQANEIAAKALRKAGHKTEQKIVSKPGAKFEKKVWVYAESEGENAGKSCGGVRKGQNAANECGGTGVIWWSSGSRKEKNEDTGKEETRRWMSLKSYNVFNVEQCDPHVVEYFHAPKSEEETGPKFDPIAACETICEGYEIETHHGGDRASYSPTLDRIRLPNREQFSTPEAYYTTRFHEMGHSTGHPTRLNRKGIAQFDGFGSHQYADEELVAEFTASFLAGEAGIVRTTEGNSAAYLKNWASKLRDDPKLVVYAAQRASKAADLVLGREAPGKPEEAKEGAEAA